MMSSGAGLIKIIATGLGMKRENRRAIGIMAIINGARVNSMKLINDRLRNGLGPWIEGYCKIYSDRWNGSLVKLTHLRNCILSAIVFDQFHGKDRTVNEYRINFRVSFA